MAALRLRRVMMKTFLRLLFLPCFFVLAGMSLPAATHGRKPYVWRSVPIGGGGYVTDVYCHPKQKDLVYIRTDVGGFYRWDARNARWVPLTDRFPRSQSNYYGGEGLALDPSNPHLVYIAAGKYEWASPGTIFKSSDQGRSWKKLPLDLPMGGNEDHRWGGPRLVVSPFHPSVLLFGSREGGLWRSADAGASWSKVGAFPATLKAGVRDHGPRVFRKDAGRSSSPRRSGTGCTSPATTGGRGDGRQGDRRRWSGWRRGRTGRCTRRTRMGSESWQVGTGWMSRRQG